MHWLRKKCSFGARTEPDAYSALFDHGLASKSDQRFAFFTKTLLAYYREGDR